MAGVYAGLLTVGTVDGLKEQGYKTRGLNTVAPAFARLWRSKYTFAVKKPSTKELPCACSTLRKASCSVNRLYDAALAEAGASSAQQPILRAAS